MGIIRGMREEEILNENEEGREVSRRERRTQIPAGHSLQRQRGAAEHQARAEGGVPTAEPGAATPPDRALALATSAPKSTGR